MADSQKGKGGGKPKQGGEKKENASTQPPKDTKPKTQDNKAENKPQAKDNKQAQPKDASNKKDTPKDSNANKSTPEVKESKKEETKTTTPTNTTAPVTTTTGDAQQTTTPSSTKPKKEKVEREYVKGKGTVKAVPSGDSVVILQLEQKKPPTEKEITLSNISAPKLARRGANSTTKVDEEFAFASREFLRKNIIGKNVAYLIESKPAAKGSREYGNVYLIGKDGKDSDLAQLLVGEGFATVRKREAKEGQTLGPLRSDVEQLMQLQEEAVKAGKGVHTKNAGEKARAIRPTLNFTPSELYEKSKGAPQHGVVEKVITGSTVIVTLPATFHEFKIVLSGVECPDVRSDGTSEPLGREAKFLTEYFLLHRDVQVIFEGADKFTTYGTLDCNGVNISEELLKRGLAKFVEWSGNRTAFAQKLKNAEKLAQNNKSGIWGNYVEDKSQPDDKKYKVGREIIGKVTSIINSGMITVVEGKTEHTINLSSISVPRGGNMRPKKREEKEDKNAVVGEAPKEKSAEVKEKERRERVEALERTYAWEGKEYLRRRLIGQRVRCVLDYIQPPIAQNQNNNNQQNNQNQTQEKPKEQVDRNYFSVYLDKNNVAVELVANGLALPRNHRGGESRSKDYEDILKAETVAKKAGKGRFYPEERAAVLYINDISQDAEKARQFLPSIKRGKQRGVVVHVFNPSKFKIYVPKESCELTLSLSALKTPRNEEPFFNEAMTMIKEKLMQRDVEFEVTAVDRGGNFVGNAWAQRENIATSLLNEGFGKLLRGIAQDSEYYSELDIAEETAKKNRRNVWKDYDEVAENEKREKRREENALKRGASSTSNTEFMDVIITEILDANTFYIQVVGDEAEKLEDLMSGLQSEEDTTDSTFAPKVKDLVKAQYSADDLWYRGQIVSNADGQVRVFYVDYGNSETIPVSRIKPLSAKFRELKPQSSEAHLAFVKAPSLDADYGPEAAQFLKELVEGKTMMANTEYRDSHSGALYLSLGDRESQVHVNAALVRAGLAKVKRPREYMSKPKAAVDQLVNKLREEETQAKTNHSCMWEYGDPGSDDDAEEETRGIKKKEKGGDKKSTPVVSAKGGKEEKK